MTEWIRFFNRTHKSVAASASPQRSREMEVAVMRAMLRRVVERIGEGDAIRPLPRDFEPGQGRLAHAIEILRRCPTPLRFGDSPALLMAGLAVGRAPQNDISENGKAVPPRQRMLDKGQVCCTISSKPEPPLIAHCTCIVPALSLAILDKLSSLADDHSTGTT